MSPKLRTTIIVPREEYLRTLRYRRSEDGTETEEGEWMRGKGCGRDGGQWGREARERVEEGEVGKR